MNKKQFLWISKQQLDVLKKVAPTNHIRHYLNGIFINPKGYLEATDGFVAIRIKIDDVNELPKEPILLTHSVIYNNEKKCVIFQYKNIEMAFLM